MKSDNERKKARVKTTTNTIESYFEQIKPNELKRDENYNRIKALLENHTSKDREKRDKTRLSSQDNTCAKSFQWKEMKYLLHMNEVEYKLQSFFFFFHHLHSLLLLFLCSTHTSHTNFIKFICNAKWAVQLIGVNEWSVKEKNSVSSMIDHILLHLDSIDIKQYNMNVWKLQYRFSRRDGGREVGFEQE